MLTPGTTSWHQAIPTLITAIVLLFGPGGVAVRLTGARWFTAAAVGPAITVTMIGVGGILAGAAGIPWGPAALAGTTGVTWVIVLGGRLAVRLVVRFRRRADSEPATDPDDAATEPECTAWGRLLGTLLRAAAPVVGLAGAFYIVRKVLIGSSERPELFPQHPDTIFHLGLAQWMVEHHDISALHSNGWANPQGGQATYPVGFHDLTATLSMLTGVPVVVATSCFVLVAAGLAWPVGSTYLARSVLGTGPVVGVVAPIASVLLTVYPYMIMGFGVLWPNLLGQALLPGVLALVVALNGRRKPSRTQSERSGTVLLLLLAAIPGLTLAHPNATVTLFVYGWFIVLVAVLRRTWADSRRTVHRWRPLATLGAVTALGIVVYLLERPASMVATGNPGPEIGAAEGFRNAIELAPRGAAPLTLLAVVALLGAVVALVKPRYRTAAWAVPTALLFLVLFWGNVAVDNGTWRIFTWPWYNNAVRLEVAGSLAITMLLTTAVVGVCTLLGQAVSRGLGQLAWSHPQLTEVGAAAFAVVLIAVVVVPTHAWVASKVAWLRPYFHPHSARSWASPRELKALHAMAAVIPRGVDVAANPWNGATYLWVVGDRTMLYPTEKVNNTPDRQLLGLKLNQVGVDPEVCVAARRLHVDYAITGGRPFLWALSSDLAGYVGIDALPKSHSAFVKQGVYGPYTLWRRTGCAQ